MADDDEFRQRALLALSQRGRPSPSPYELAKEIESQRAAELAKEIANQKAALDSKMDGRFTDWITGKVEPDPFSKRIAEVERQATEPIIPLSAAEIRARAAIEAYGYKPDKPRLEVRKDKPTEGPTLREEIERAHAAANRAMPAHPVPPPPIAPVEPPHIERNKFSATDFVMFIVGGLLAVPLCDAGWHAVVSGENQARGYIAIAAGLALGIPTASFHWLKDKVSNKAQAWIRRNAYWWLPASVALFFLYMVGPDMYQRATAIEAPKTVAPAAAAPAPPIVLSEDEKQFRHDLRIFVLSTMGQQQSAFWQLATQLSNNNTNNLTGDAKDKLEALDTMEGDLLRFRFADTYDALSKDVNKEIEAIDLNKTVADLRLYFDAYNDAEIYFRDFLLVTGINPNKQNLFIPWVEADELASRSLQDLKASPISSASNFKNLNGFAPVRTRFQSYLTLPTSPPTP